MKRTNNLLINKNNILKDIREINNNQILEEYCKKRKKNVKKSI